MSEHELKTWPGPFAEIRRGTKTHEVRKFDRPFAMGDTLRLREYAPADVRGAPGRYTGEEMRVLVTSIAVGSWGLPPDLCVMSIRAIADATTRAPERVTDEELAEIERLDHEATPGPWTEYAPDFPEYENPGVRHAGDADHGRVARIASRQADAAFIAAARTLLPRLAVELRAHREDAAIGRLLDEAGGTAREGETLRERVERLIEDANGGTTCGGCGAAWGEIHSALCAVRAGHKARRISAEEREERGHHERVLLHAQRTVDAFRARAEAVEAELAALRAPVDVAGEVDAIAHAAVQMGAQSGAAVRGAVRDVVERAARLAREAEGLRAELVDARIERFRRMLNVEQLPQIVAVVSQGTPVAWIVLIVREGGQLPSLLGFFEREDDAREFYDYRGAQWSDSYLCEVKRRPCDGMKDAPDVRAELAAARAEIERLRADLACETARRDEHIAQLEQCLGAKEQEATQYRVAASRAAEVLRAVEWSGVADGGDPGPEPSGCPCCGADKPGPHAAACKLAACLTRTP